MNHIDFLTSIYDVKIPKLIYGTAWKKDRTAELVTQAIKQGFRGIDTACQPKHYHETGVGEGIAVCLLTGLNRDDLFLQTKFTPLSGQDPLHVPYDKDAGLEEQVFQSFQISLNNLQTTYLDSLVLHSPLTNQRDLLKVWQAMEQIYRSGHVKQLGISNCYDLQQFKSLYSSVAIKPAVIQNRFYADTQYDHTIREFCKQKQIIYQGFWTLTANPKILADSLIKHLAMKYQVSAAQIFYRYLSQIGIIPLTGTTSIEHMRQDLAIFEFELNGDECAAIDILL